MASGQKGSGAQYDCGGGADCTFSNSEMKPRLDDMANYKTRTSNDLKLSPSIITPIMDRIIEKEGPNECEYG